MCWLDRGLASVKAQYVIDQPSQAAEEQVFGLWSAQLCLPCYCSRQTLVTKTQNVSRFYIRTREAQTCWICACVSLPCFSSAVICSMFASNNEAILSFWRLSPVDDLNADERAAIMLAVACGCCVELEELAAAGAGVPLCDRIC